MSQPQPADREWRGLIHIGPPLPVPSHRWVGIPLVVMLWLDYWGSLPPHFLAIDGHPLPALIAASLGTIHLVVWGRGKLHSIYFAMTIFWLAARAVELLTHDYGYKSAAVADGVARNVVLAFLVYRLWVRRMAEAES